MAEDISAWLFSRELNQTVVQRKVLDGACRQFLYAGL